MLPPIDVVFENDQPPPTQRTGGFSPSEVEALRRIVRDAPTSSAPPARPSLPVRAARSAKDKSPWIGLGILIVEVVRYVLTNL
jgi:hypothetical protein